MLQTSTPNHFITFTFTQKLRFLNAICLQVCFDFTKPRQFWISRVNKSSQFYVKNKKQNKMSTCKLWKIRFKMLRGDCDCCLDDCCEENTNLVTSDDFIDSLVSIWVDFVLKFREIMSKKFPPKNWFHESFQTFSRFC